MILHKTPPDLSVYTPDRRNMLSNIWCPYDMSCDYNFGAASQMSFTVQKYIYNTQNEKWVKNPCYDYLDTDMVINSTDNDDYFRFNGWTVQQDFPLRSSLIARGEYHPAYNAGNNICNVSFRPEIKLYDVGINNGYLYTPGCYIENGGYIDGSDNMPLYYKRIACKEFFPVEVGDVIYLVSKNKITGDGSVEFTHYIDAYNEADAASWNKQVLTNYTANPTARIRVDTSWFNGQKKGYIRFSAGVPSATYNNQDGSWSSTYPDKNYVHIYSGQIYYDYVTSTSTGKQKIKIPWWVITNVEENTDNINATKTITAHSYEYTLSKRTFSISNGTLPLYIPPNLYNRVHSSNWLYDAYENANGGVSAAYGSQRMSNGLVNQILEWLPNWSIGYISREVIGKYRTFDNIDNANIYSFLINEVQSKFNCFVIFDVDKMTINLISKRDCILKSNTTLTWDNAVKSMEISNTDNRFVTAMRVHTSDDTYGIGLINPTGNNIIYDFSSYKEHMNFVADSTKNRTLYEAAKSNLMNISDLDEYRKYAKTVIEKNMEVIELKAKVAEALTKYCSKADIINMYLQDTYKSSHLPADYYISDKPRKAMEEMVHEDGKYHPKGNFSNYHSEILYKELRSLAETYEKVKASYEKALDEYNTAYNAMKNIARKSSITSSLNKSYGFSELELKALSHFIVEGDWTNLNAVFSDTYSADDIYDTLVDVYDDAKSELSAIYSKRNYDFTVETANILAMDEMKSSIEELALGNSLRISRENEWIEPVLLSVHIDYNDLSNFTMSFSTDYNRKPLALRFNDLFGTINQTSVITPTFTFNNE